MNIQQKLTRSFITGLALSLLAFNVHAVKCDVDDDGDIDRLDINQIFADRGQTASGPDDPRDADSNLAISIADGRLCTRLCTLASCAIPPSNTAPLANAGPDIALPVLGVAQLDGSASSDADGDVLSYRWTLTQRPAGSNAALNNAFIVNPQFTLDVAGDYVVELIVNDGTIDSLPDVVQVTTNNSPPLADAGPDQSPLVATTVSLNGSGSTDIDGDNLSFSWQILSQPAGSNTTLSDPSASMPSLYIDQSGSYEIQLIVNDGSVDSLPDVVLLTTSNSAPVAHAGPDQSALVGQTVVLDATNSSDVDGDSLTYSWSVIALPAGSAASLSDANSAMPSINIDVAGNYTLQLIVNDGLLDSSPDTVVISTDNTPPTANAGPDQSPFVNSTVQLDGSASSDVDGDALTYLWALTSKPQGSAATLSDVTAVMPQLMIDVSGTYVAQLIVNDGAADSAPDTVLISTQNSAPQANAGADQRADLNDIVTLDGSASLDVDADSLTYLWSLIARPAGSLAVLDNPNSVTPQFTVDVAGSYTAQLVVNDGLLSSAPDTVVIATNNTRPVANAGADQQPAVGATVNLDGSGSSDADGDPLTYAWSISTKPAASSAVLSSNNTVNTSITIDVAGVYVVQLIVDDGSLSSVADTVLLVTENQAPQANAGPDQSAVVGQTVTFNGGASSDPDVNPLTYAWSIVAAPAGSNASLVDANTVAAQLTPDVAGEYQVQLIVNDGALDSAADTADLTVSPALQTLTLDLDSPRVGVARTINGTVTLGLPAPAGGVNVSLVSSQPGFVSVSPGSVFIAEAVTSAQFSLTGIAEGASIITASATDYLDATASVQATSALITLGDPGTLAPEQSASLAVSLSNPAPVGGVLVSLVSSDPNIVNVDASIFIPEGMQVASTNPQVTGDQVGTATITASSDLFAPDSRDIDVSLTVSFNPASATVVENATANVTVNLSAPAPSSGLLLNLTSSDTAIVTAPSTITVPAGQLSAQFAVSGVAPGGAQVTASAPGIPDATLAVNVTTAPPINFASSVSVGFNLQTIMGGSLGTAAPAGNLIVTLTSADPARVLLANTATAAGTASIQVQVNAGSIGIPSFFVQGLADTGSVLVTATAPGYANGSFNVILEPAGFYINRGDISTSVFSDDTNVSLRLGRLNPVTNTLIQVQALRGGLTVAVDMTSSDPGVGTISSGNSFTGNSSAINAVFSPQSAGTTTLSLVQPAGFVAPTNVNTTIEASVTASQIILADVLVGVNLQTSGSLTLQAAPPAPVAINLVVADPSILLLSTDPVAAGSSTLSFNHGASTFVATLYFHGVSQGSTSVTVSAPGYETRVTNVQVTPSGVYFTSSDFTTTTFSTNVNVGLRTVRLAPGTNNFAAHQAVRGGTSLSVSLTSSDLAVGSIASPLTIAANQSTASAAFTPVGAGVTALTIIQPAGFTAPANLGTEIDATVTAPTINHGDSQVGLNLQEARSLSLAAAPPVATDFTVSIANPSVAVVSKIPTEAGSGTQIFNGVTSSFAGTFYIQGLSVGSTTVTISAPGYATQVSTVDVTPSGFYFTSSSFSTTSFSANRSVGLRTARLNPLNNNFAAHQAVRGGLTVEVPLTSSDTNVGTISSPLSFAGNTSVVNASFDPISAGVASLSITQPSGFSAPANLATSIVATVTAPSINISDVTVGKDLQTTISVTLDAAPPSPVDVVISATAPAIAIMSNNPTFVGSGTITFSNVNSTFVATLVVQGLAIGTTNITASAPGYNDGVATVTVDPSGFAIASPGNFTTTTSAANSSISIRPFRLNPTTLNIVSIQQVRGGLTLDVGVQSSAPAVGAITLSPVTFNGNDSSKITQFDPLTAGSTAISLLQPAGMATPSNSQSIVVTVNP